MMFSSISELKTVNAIYLQTWAKGKYTFTSEEFQTLYNIAAQRPVIYGDAVYSARVMIGEEGSDMVSYRLANVTTPISSYFGKAYPNPANNEVSLNYK